VAATYVVSAAGVQTVPASVGGGYARDPLLDGTPEASDWIGGMPAIWQIEERENAVHRRLRYWRMQVSGQNLMIPTADFEASRLDMSTVPAHLRPGALEDLFIFAVFGESGWPLPALSYMADDVSQAGGGGWWRTRGAIVLGTRSNGLPILLPVRPVWPGVAMNSALFGVAAFGAIELTAWGWRAGVRLVRGRRGHCPSCAYDLRGIRGRCPECGRAPGGGA